MALTAVDIFAEENTDRSGKLKDLGLKLKTRSLREENFQIIQIIQTVRNGIKIGYR
jgi:hypothetical protein